MPFNAILLAGSGIPAYEISITSDRAEWKKSVDASQIPSNSPVILRFNVASSIRVQSVTAGQPSITLDGLAEGSVVQIVNAGDILGRGGDGNSGAGTHAIYADFTGELSIDNIGNIWGGGGGGGLGGYAAVWISGDISYEPTITGGGGGGGAGGGAGGAGPGGSNGNPGTVGVAGVPGTGGAGGTGSGAGGSGGIYGAVGANGASGAYVGGPLNGQSLNNGAVGGLAGFAVKHLAGTILSWISGDSDPERKGSIGV